ncbi:MAG: hypothetical protein JWM53_6252 [bacterium]|nr:hypothetical protein [bacterium]
MRLLCAVLLLAWVGDAVAQEPPPPPTVEPSPVVEAAPPPPLRPTMDPAAMSLSVAQRPLTERTVAKWRGARALQICGGVTGLISTGLSLSSTIYIFATGYPPSASDLVRPAKPTDTGAVLAYVSSATSALGFTLSAGGLGWQHGILRELDADPGRNLYIGGTVVGVLGLIAIGASYFLGFTNYLDTHDQTIAALATSLGGAALCTTAAGIYAVDSSRMKKAWRNLTSF